MRKYVLSLAFALFLGAGFLFTSTPTQAQEAKNSIYAELGGNSLIYSINYDRRFGPKWTGRLGVMSAGIGDVGLTFVPLMGNYLVGSGNHRLELGVGPQILRASIDVPQGQTADGFAGIDESVTTVAGTATIGYRYQPMDGGFQFRIGLTPSFTPFGFLPWGGLSLGWAF